jgi:hypothetical protein
MTNSACGIVQQACTFGDKIHKEISVSNVKWDKQKAKRRENLKLAADVKGLSTAPKCKLKSGNTMSTEHIVGESGLLKFKD